MSNVQVAQATGQTPAAAGRVQFARATGVGTISNTPRVQISRVVGAGATLPRLTTAQLEYEAGQLVTVISDALISGAQWSAAGVATPQLVVNGAACSFVAPATVDGTTITVQYGVDSRGSIPISVLPQISWRAGGNQWVPQGELVTL